MESQEPIHTPAQEQPTLTGWFVFYKDQLLIEKTPEGQRIPFATEPPVPVPIGSTIHTIGEIEGCKACTYAVHAPVPGSESEHREMMDLRSSYDVLPWDHYYTAGKAFQILNWDKNSRYCPMCGVPTVQISPIAKKCPQCRQEIYPRISPAIIVLIRKGDSILLVHARNFRGTFKGLVAGFLEPGETLEECVHREVREETGLTIRNLRYFGSQPWPYPSGIMIGYTADYAGGEIKLQREELSAGAFYHRDNLPEIPKKLSLARKLIDAWLEEQEKKNPEEMKEKNPEKKKEMNPEEMKEKNPEEKKEMNPEEMKEKNPEEMKEMKKNPEGK